MELHYYRFLLLLSSYNIIPCEFFKHPYCYFIHLSSSAFRFVLIQNVFIFREAPLSVDQRVKMWCDSETTEHSVLDGMSPSNHSPRVSGNHVKEKMERLHKQGGWRTRRKQSFLNTEGQVFAGTHRAWQHVQDWV